MKWWSGFARTLARMTDLANKLVDLARGEAAAITLQNIPVDLYATP